MDVPDVDVVVVVVTHDSERDVAGFLSSLAPGLAGIGSYHLVVVDNDSRDRTLAIVTDAAPGATVVRMRRNVGYAAAINAGVAVARHRGRAVLIANPDVRLGPGCVAELLDVVDGRPEVGIVVPQLRGLDGSLARTIRREPTFLRAFGEAVLGGRLAGCVPALGEIVVPARRYAEPTACDWACGAVVLVARRCLDDIGPWDPSFFLYSEETEFALRARDAGWVTWYTPRARAVHVGGAAHASPALWSLLTLNRWRLYRQRHGRAASAAFRAALVLGEAIRAAAGRSTSRAALRSLLTRHAPAAVR